MFQLEQKINTLVKDLNNSNACIDAKNIQLNEILNVNLYFKFNSGKKIIRNINKRQII